MMQGRISVGSGHVNLKERPRGPNGRGLCRWCGKEVPKGRLTFCSKDCVHQHLLRSSPGYLRSQVFKRDRGVCAQCGLDTEALRSAIDYVRALFWKLQRPGTFSDFLRALGKKAERWRSSLWDADHITPVAEGGGGCDLSNMRTLCLECHAYETRWLHRRLRHKRDGRKSRPLYQEAL